MEKIHIFTHSDLDGAGSFLATSWCHPDAEITYTPVISANTLREQLLEWLVKHNFSDYDRVYVLDLDCYESKELIDHENVTIIDHHKTHSDAVQQSAYSCEHIVKEYTSASKLCQLELCEKFEIEFTNAQKAMVMICDDYDSYTLKSKFSKPLNTVFYGITPRFHGFVERYKNGFDGFNKGEQSMIRIAQQELKNITSNLKECYGTLSKYKVVCAIATSHINEVHSYLLKKCDCDISIIIIPRYDRVSWRKQKDCDAPLHLISEKICEGGGHEYAAGGRLTEKFLALTKTFK